VTATTKVPSDIAIAQAAKLRPVADIAAELGLEDDELELYGKYKAKVRLAALARRQPRASPRRCAASARTSRCASASRLWVRCSA